MPLTDGKEVEYKEYMACINGNAHRIHMAYADLEVSAPIVQSLVNEVEAMRLGREIPFNWDTLHRQAVDKLFRITNGEPLEMDELEKLSMLIVRADPNDSKHYPFLGCRGW